MSGSLVRGVHSLHLGDTPEEFIVPPAPAPAPMPNSRKPPQARPKQQPRGNFRCAQRGPDPSAFRRASDHGLMLHMVQKHGFFQLIQESVAKLRNLDRAACVDCDTIRSQRCRRCNFCGSDTPLRDLIFGDTFQDHRQPGHQDAAPDGSPTVEQPPHSSQTTRSMTARSRTAPLGTSFSQNATSSYSPNFAEPPQWLSHAASSLAMPRRRRGQKASKEVSAVTSHGLCSAVTFAACFWLRFLEALTETRN